MVDFNFSTWTVCVSVVGCWEDWRVILHPDPVVPFAYVNSSIYLSFSPKAGSINSLSIKTGNTAVMVSRISGAGEVSLRSGGTGAIVVLSKTGL